MVIVGLVEESETPETWELAPDKTFKKKLLQRGTGLVCPRDGSVCRVRVTPVGNTDSDTVVCRSLRLKSSEIEEFVVGENDTELDYILDKILEFMKPGEIDLVQFQIHSEEQTDVNVNPSNLTGVELKVELVSFQEVAEIWELNPFQLVDAAKHHKDEGVTWYKAGKTLYALRRFAKAMRFLLVIDRTMIDSLAEENPDVAELKIEYLNLKLSLYLNIAAIQLISGNLKSVIENCTKALEIDPETPKALYRRGVAHARNKDSDSAKRDLLAALKMEPNDAGIRRELQKLGVRATLNG